MTLLEFDIKLVTEKFCIDINVCTGQGYFEHIVRGDDCAGSLLFDGKTLLDYDGVPDLPKDVRQALAAAGYSMEGEDLATGDPL